MKAMFYQLGILAFLGLNSSILTAQAVEHPMDLTVCASGTISMLAKNDDLLAWTWDEKGIAWSNIEEKSLDNITVHCGGVFAIVAGEKPMQGYCKLLDTDGDYFVMRIERVGATVGAVLKPLSGTGKWKGISGNMKTKRLRTGKAVASGTYQNCYHYIGTYELTK